MATETEYVLMAGAAYRDTREDINRVPIPSGWNLVSREPQNGSSGFEASAFGNGATLETSTEIVISFAGTYPEDVTGDWAANIALGGGNISAQILQAVDYYLSIKAVNPDPNTKITLS